MIRALCAKVERLHPALAARGVPIPSAMPTETAAVAVIAEAAIRRGDRHDRSSGAMAKRSPERNTGAVAELNTGD